MSPAVLIFADDGVHPLCRLLRPGYRHVETLIWQHERWWWVAWTGSGLDVGVMPAGFDPQAWAHDNGWAALETHVRPAPWRLGLGLHSCVSIAKLALGIRAPLVLTPWQLARWVRRHGRCTEQAEGQGP